MNAFSPSTVEASHNPNVPIKLLPNTGKFNTTFISGLFIRVLIPVFIFHVLLIKGLSLKGLAYWGVFVPIISLIGGAFFTYIRKERKQLDSLALSISDEMLFLSWKDKPVQEIPLTGLQVDELGWGPDVHSLLPAIRLQSEGLPPLTIGTMEASARWADYRKSVACVDFIVEDEQSWNQMMAWLKE